MQDREFLPRNCDVAVTGFAVLTQMHRDQVQEHRRHAAGGVPSAGTRRDARPVNSDPSSGQNKGLLDGLADLTLDEREALLLVAVEQFSYAQASQILQVSQAGLVARLAQARNRLGAVLTAASYPPDPGTRRGSHLRLVK
jgi:RNA polymerase sigma-70 factor (ECF subfamily)